MWCFKWLITFAIFVASFWIKNEFFSGWADFSRVGSLFFLMFQAYFILNWLYIANDVLWSALETDEACYARFLIFGVSIFFNLISFIANAFFLVWFGGCGLTKGLSMFTLVLNILYFIIPWLDFCGVEFFRKNATIFVFGVAMSYITFLGWSMLESYPDTTCNTLSDSWVSNFLQILLGLMFTFATIWSVATASKA